MEHLAVLTALAARFQPSVPSAAAPLERTLRIDPPPDALGPAGLALSETVQEVTQVDVPLKVDLAFVGKWVRSPNSDLPADPAAENPIGGMPIVEQVPLATGLATNLPPPSQMTSDQGMGAVPGVPEVLGRVRGVISQTVDKVTDVSVSLPIGVAVRWRVLDEATGGPPPVGVQYKDTAGSWQLLGSEVLLPAGGSPAAGTPMALSLRFPVMFTELTAATPDTLRVSVRASVKLSVVPAAGGAAVTTDWVDLPAVPLVIPTIPVPTILVLCEHRDFAGRKLVLVPASSPLAAGAGGLDAGTALAMTNAALVSLLPSNTLVPFLAAFTGGPADTAANVLKSLTPSSGQTIVEAQSQVNDLSAAPFVFDPGGFLGIGRFTADNMASSIICVGRMGTVFDFFQDPNLSERITRLQVTTDGSLGCAIRKLDLQDPSPDVVYGAIVTSFSPVWPHEDRITSVSFGGTAGRFQALPFA